MADRPITEAERDLALILRRCPAVAADFEKSCAKEASRIMPQLANRDPKHAIAFMLTEALEHLNHKRRKGVYRYGNKGAGNCYDAALNTFMGFTDDDPKLEARLCHGRVTVVDKNIPHAWVEVGGLCIDPSNHRDWPLIIGHDRFYKTQGVQAETVFRYTRAEVIKQNRRTTHFGPWEGPDAVPPLV